MSASASDSTISSAGYEVSNSRTGSREPVREILGSLAVVTVPLSVLSAALLAVIFVFRVNSAPPSLLQQHVAPLESGAVYVRLDSARLALVASFSSTVAPFIAGSAMTLLVYPLSATMAKLSREQQLENLPTPLQLSMLVSLRNGGILSIFPWIQYISWRRSHKTIQSLRMLVLALLIASVLTLLITLADTWFHLATTTAEIMQRQQQTPERFYGRQLNSYCVAPMPEFNPTLPCSLDVALATYYLVGGPEAYKTLGNISTTNRLITVEDSGRIYVLLGDVQSTEIGLDFMASTIAMNTECQVISKNCSLQNFGDQVLYNCSSAFQGDFTYKSANAVNTGVAFNIGHFNDTALTIPSDNVHFYNPNPSYIAMAARVDSSVNTPLYPNGSFEYAPSLSGDWNGTDIVIDPSAAVNFVLGCVATIYDVTYTFVNGSFNNFTSMNISNDTLSGIINIPQHQNFTFATNYYAIGAISAVLSNTSQEVADKMALTYSQTALGTAAGVFVGSNNLVEESWSTFLAAKIPFAPLAALIAANLSFVCAGLVLAVFAIPNRRLETVASLFTVPGVVAHGFGEIRDGIKLGKRKHLFEESRTGETQVIGVVQAENGQWKFASWHCTLENEGILDSSDAPASSDIPMV